jgi:hypothetical protein
MATSSRISKTVAIVSVHEQKSDFAFWQTQPCEVRLATLEQIRREYHQWRYGAEPRLQRVVSIRALRAGK